MRILITGAAGFIGQLVAKKLLNDEKGAHSLILTDIIEPPIPDVRSRSQAQAIKADLCTEADSVVTKDIDAVYVFHGIMSSGAEADFELGMKANFDATRALLEAIRKTCPGARVIYASSQAVYNNSVTLPVTESQMPTPETSYGAEKMMCEYLITEYTRRGFIDGISLRFPTVSVRPGKPTAAASSFISGMIREPMHQMRYSIRRQAMATLALFSSHSSPESSLRSYRFRHQSPRKVRPLLELPWHRRLSAGHDGFAC
jgi:nucleoside-diphosphate-sugar epimerase